MQIVKLWMKIENIDVHKSERETELEMIEKQLSQNSHNKTELNNSKSQ